MNTCWYSLTLKTPVMDQQSNYQTTQLWMRKKQGTSHYQEVSAPMQKIIRFWWITQCLAYLLSPTVWQWLHSHNRQEWDQYSKKKTLILKGHRNNTDGSWEIHISRPLRHHVHGIITRDNTKTELIQYLHGCFFRPIPRTFLKAIKNGDLITLVGLNNQHFLKHLPPSIITALVHLD